MGKLFDVSLVFSSIPELLEKLPITLELALLARFRFLKISAQIFLPVEILPCIQAVPWKHASRLEFN